MEGCRNSLKCGCVTTFLFYLNICFVKRNDKKTILSGKTFKGNTMLAFLFDVLEN